MSVRSAVKVCVLLWFALAASASSSLAHDGAASSAGLRAPGINLRDLILDLVQNGITLARPAEGIDHSAHFIGADSDQFGALISLTEDIALQVASFPLSTSAGGFSYVFDADLGVLTRSSESFGPIYTDRAVTIGKGRVNVGVSYNHYTFDSIDDASLRDGDLYLVFTHEDTNGDGGSLLANYEGDIVTGQLQLKIQSSTTTIVSTYGLTDRFDVGFAVPVVSVDIVANTTANIRRIATGPESPIHQFENGTSTDSFGQEGSATGVGDIVVRGKYRLGGTTRAGMAMAVDLRLPTGEERNLHGTGAFQAKGALVASFERNGFAPHASVGYAYNTDDVPSEIPHFLGVEWAPDQRVTFIADFLGRYVMDTVNVEIQEQTFTARQGGTSVEQQEITAVYPEIALLDGESRYYASGAIGVKMMLRDNLLVSFNGLFSMSKSGLADRFTPLLGIDYSF